MISIRSDLHGFSTETQSSRKPPYQRCPILTPSDWDKKISSLPVSAKIKFLIVNGNDGSYPSRSEADQAVITALVNKGMDFADIKAIFENYRIGEKYREHSSPDDLSEAQHQKGKGIFQSHRGRAPGPVIHIRRPTQG